MSETPRLGLPYVQGAQSQKHVTVNESLRRLDVLTSIVVIDRDLTAPPASPADGDTYIAGANPTGAWVDSDFNIFAWLDGAWEKFVPFEGQSAWILDESEMRIWDGENWVLASELSGGVTIETLADGSIQNIGIGAAATEDNKLFVRGLSAVFDGTGEEAMFVTINKDAFEDQALLIFQNSFTTKAILGLSRDDDFSIIVSNDGIDFEDALKIAPSGEATMQRLVIDNPNTINRVNFIGNNDVDWRLEASSGLFSIVRSTGGFGTGGRVLSYDDSGALGLWGAPNPAYRIAILTNQNADDITSIIHLEQTASSNIAGQVMSLKNRASNLSRIFRCETNNGPVMDVVSRGEVKFYGVINPGSFLRTEMPTAGTVPGSTVYCSNATGGGSLATYDGANWISARTGNAV